MKLINLLAPNYQFNDFIHDQALFIRILHFNNWCAMYNARTVKINWRYYQSGMKKICPECYNNIQNMHLFTKAFFHYIEEHTSRHCHQLSRLVREDSWCAMCIRRPLFSVSHHLRLKRPVSLLFLYTSFD